MNLIILLILLLNSFNYTEDIKQVEDVQVEKKEDIKEDIKELKLYWNEFKQEYIIKINNDYYYYNIDDEIIINEWEDIDEYNLQSIKNNILY